MVFCRDATARSDPKIINLCPPFSNFKFVDNTFGPSFALRRIFSQARSLGCKTLVIEDIEASGAVAEENVALAKMDCKYQCSLLQRLTFWTRSVGDVAEFPGMSSSHLAGYAILKRDVLSSKSFDSLHVFESVVRKYPHVHNCIPGMKRYGISCLGGKYVLPGVMYCQQNQLNKACAQVAIRSLLSLFCTDDDFPYGNINSIAADVKSFDPADGLDSDQVSAVLRGNGLNVKEINYELSGVSPDDMPYDKWMYSAIESGRGGLIGFEFSGSEAKGRRHIVPFFGHTFNQDTWAPKALRAYFRVGENVRFISSLQWMSSFLGHDDNFGSNYCVPRHFIRPENVKYVASVLPDHCLYDGTVAEACALTYLYSSLPAVLSDVGNPWVMRAVHYIQRQEVVLRAVAVTRGQYLKRLSGTVDWDGGQANAEWIDFLKKILPPRLWMVEISIPDLFAANHHKVGEILLDSKVPAKAPEGSHHLVMLRLPGAYLLPKQGFPAKADFYRIASPIESHSSVFRFRGRSW